MTDFVRYMCSLLSRPAARAWGCMNALPAAAAAVAIPMDGNAGQYSNLGQRSFWQPMLQPTRKELPSEMKVGHVDLMRIRDSRDRPGERAPRLLFFCASSSLARAATAGSEQEVGHSRPEERPSAAVCQVTPLGCACACPSPSPATRACCRSSLGTQRPFRSASTRVSGSCSVVSASCDITGRVCVCCALTRCGVCVRGRTRHAAATPADSGDEILGLLKLCAATALELCAPATHAHTRASCAHARPFGLRTAAAAVAHLNGAALHSAHTRLTWPCSAPCTGLLCPRAADSALHGRPGVMDRGERELRAPRAAPRRLQAGWGWPGGGPRPRCGRLWWRRRCCRAVAPLSVVAIVRSVCSAGLC